MRSYWKVLVHEFSSDVYKQIYTETIRVRITIITGYKSKLIVLPHVPQISLIFSRSRVRSFSLQSIPNSKSTILHSLTHYTDERNVVVAPASRISCYSLSLNLRISFPPRLRPRCSIYHILRPLFLGWTKTESNRGVDGGIKSNIPAFSLRLI